MHAHRGNNGFSIDTPFFEKFEKIWQKLKKFSKTKKMKFQQTDR